MSTELESYRSNLRVLGTVALVVSSLWLFCAGMFVLVGTLGGLGVLDPHESAADRLFGVAGTAVVSLLCLASGVANLAAGLGLRRVAPWGRTAGFVAATLNIVAGCGCAVGLALGVWMLVVLLDSRAQEAFAPQAD